MTDIEFRWRDYKDPNKRGTYLLVNGRQHKRVSGRRLTIQEMNALRKNMLLSNEGYIQENSKTHRKYVDENHIKEVKEGSLNIEISDIYKENDKWEKESKEDREYLSKENVKKLKKVI